MVFKKWKPRTNPKITKKDNLAPVSATAADLLSDNDNPPSEAGDGAQTHSSTIESCGQLGSSVAQHGPANKDSSMTGIRTATGCSNSGRDGFVPSDTFGSSYDPKGVLDDENVMLSGVSSQVRSAIKLRRKAGSSASACVKGTTGHDKPLALLSATAADLLSDNDNPPSEAGVGAQTHSSTIQPCGQLGSSVAQHGPANKDSSMTGIRTATGCSNSGRDLFVPSDTFGSSYDPTGVLDDENMLSGVSSQVRSSIKLRRKAGPSASGCVKGTTGHDKPLAPLSATAADLLSDNDNPPSEAGVGAQTHQSTIQLCGQLGSSVAQHGPVNKDSSMTGIRTAIGCSNPGRDLFVPSDTFGSLYDPTGVLDDTITGCSTSVREGFASSGDSSGLLPDSMIPLSPNQRSNIQASGSLSFSSKLRCSNIRTGSLSTPPPAKKPKRSEAGGSPMAIRSAAINSTEVQQSSSTFTTPFIARGGEMSSTTSSTGLSAASRDDDHTVTPGTAEGTKFESVSLKPLTDSQAVSLAALSQRNKRKKKRKSDSGRKRGKRSLDKEIYCDKSDEVKERKKQRYIRSPAFVQRLVNRVKQHDLYVNARGYRERARRRILLDVKRKYSELSPFRNKVNARSKKRYQMNCQSRKWKDAHLKASLIYYSRNRKHCNLQRRIKYDAGSSNRNDCDQAKPHPKQAVSTSNINFSKGKILSPLIKRKYMRLQRQGAPYLPPLNANTAEARANKFRNWKRFRINAILARMGVDIDTDSYFRRQKYEVTQLLHQVLNVRQEARKQFYEGCCKLSTIYDDVVEVTSGIPDSAKKAELKKAYGGKQYHVPSMELCSFDKSSAVYVPYGDIFPEDESTNPKCAKLQIRLCDEDCQFSVPDEWPIILHQKLGLINKNIQVQKLLVNVANLEKCGDCDVNATTRHIVNNCLDVVTILQQLRPHFVGIRSLLREIYRVRHSALQMHIIELLLLDGGYRDFVAFRTEYCSRDSSRQQDPVDVKRALDLASDDFVLQEYGNLKGAFDEAVEASMEVYECCCCLRLVRRSKIKIFSSQDKFRKREDVKALERAFENHFHKINGDLAVCSSCRDYFSRKKVSPFSDRNFMWPSQVPDQLLRLNPYERQMISLAKSFQSIIKLKPYTYRAPSNTLTRAIKGLSIQLPLPLGTIPNVRDILAKQEFTMPRCSNFLIEVDSMPSMSKKNVFRSLVDMSNVAEALDWLHGNNPLYKNMVVDRRFVVLQDDQLDKLPPILHTARHEEIEGDAGAVDQEQDVQLESKIVPSKRKVRCNEASYFDTDISNNGGGTSVRSEDRQKESEARSSSTALNSESEGDFTSAVAPQDVSRRLNFSSKISCANIAIKSVGSGKGDSGKSDSSAGVRSLDATGTGGSTSSGVLMAGGQAATTFVKAQNFPIKYAVPYKKFLPDQLAESSSMVMHVPDEEMLEEFSVINMEHSLPKVADLELFALKPIKESPLSLNDPFIDVACYPHLYPYGSLGVYHRRLLYVPPASFYEHRMRISAARFRRDIPYVFDCAIRKDRAQISSSMYTMLNCGTFGDVTVGEIRKGAAAPQNSPALEKNVATLLRQVVGSPQYWLTVRLDLEAFIEEYGSATFFLTVSCAEYKLEDFKRFLEIRNTDLPNVTRTSIRNLAAVDPVSVGLHFHNRFSVFWDQVIMADNGPLGKVEHYYMRVEYQQRGAPHMHVLLWISGAPVHGTSEDGQLLDFITRHISCTLPDPVKSPELHRLVSQFQMHRCSNSCKRKKMVKGKCYCVYCRYGFPRSVNSIAKLNTTEAVMEARARGRGKLKLYDLPRRISEIMVNDYNPALLMIWGCNIDIQFIQDDRNCLVYYTTKYVCKSEKQQMSEIAETINRDLSDAGMAQSFALKLLSSRQMGAYEAADKVMRQPIYKLSSVVKSAGFYYPKDMRRRLKTKAKLDEMPDDATDVFCNNFQVSYYPNRPKPLEALCAYDVMRSYDYRYGRPPKNRDLYLPQYGISFYKRTNPVVVRLWKPRGQKSDEFERYCFQVLALFKPFRNTDELLTGPDGTLFATYAEAYQACRDQLPELQRHEAAKDRLASMVEWAEEIQMRVSKSMEQEVESGSAVCEKDVVVDLDNELAAHSKLLRDTLSLESVEASMKNLNDGQRSVFETLVHMINERRSHSTVSADGDNTPTDPKRMFVSGVGGTGKSFLITVLRNYLEFHYSKEGQPAVLVAAPTGVAAANIDGVTIHKLLKLPVSKGRDNAQLLFPLHPADSKTLRHLFANVKLLIIDEVSMLSNIFLLFIHKRLNEILIDEECDPFARFGNLNVLLLGDLLQLPPVNAPHIFKPPTRKQIENSFQSLGYSINLWRLFEFKELTENMRQREDLVYARMLERIRIGSPTNDDLEQLRGRLISPEDGVDDTDDGSLIRLAVARFLELLETDPYALCIMPLNDLVAQFNTCVMEVKKLISVTLKARDTIDSTQGGRSLAKKRKNAEQQLKQHKKKLLTTAQTGGLEEDLVLAVGARVMLRRNLDVTAKLVNGSIGYIEDIYTSADVISDRILVRFQAVPTPIDIKRVKSKYYVSGNLYIERCQFPLSLAYAVTVHKSQGLSLHSAVLDLGERTFSAGMAYVALSRVTNLSQVHLMRLEGRKIICDEASVKEYNRLRKNFSSEQLITGWNTNPEYDPKEKTFTVSAKGQARMIHEEVELQQSVNSDSAKTKKQRTVKKKKLISATDTFQTGMYLKLTNYDGHSCFANAVIQCLLRCHELYPALQGCRTSNEISQGLLEYFDAHSINERSLMSAGDLRQTFGSVSQYSVQSAVNCDPVEFTEDLLRQLPYEVSSLFMFSKRYLGTCPRSDCGRSLYVRDDGEQFLERGTVSTLEAYTLKDVFSDLTTFGYRCTFCQEVNEHFPVKAEYLFHDSNRYIILNNPVMYGASLINRPLSGLIERNLAMFGHRWRFVACIQMKASLPSLAAKNQGNDDDADEETFNDDYNRHYTAYVRHDGSQWIHLNDTAQHLMGRRPILRNMVLLILERIV